LDINVFQNCLLLSIYGIRNLGQSELLTLGSQDHVFKMGGKVIQLSDLHMCNDHEVGLANFIKLQVENGEKRENNDQRKR